MNGRQRKRKESERRDGIKHPLSGRKRGEMNERQRKRKESERRDGIKHPLSLLRAVIS